MTRPDLRLVPPVDYDTRPDLLESLARKERRLRIYEPSFRERWQFRVTVFCYVVATLAGCYFAWQLGRGAL
jgi:hypothetical protein